MDMLGFSHFGPKAPATSVFECFKYTATFLSKRASTIINFRVRKVVENVFIHSDHTPIRYILEYPHPQNNLTERYITAGKEKVCRRQGTGGTAFELQKNDREMQ